MRVSLVTEMKNSWKLPVKSAIFSGHVEVQQVEEEAEWEERIESGSIEFHVDK